MNKGISRRTILRGMGTALALPWLECMLPAPGLMANIAGPMAAAAEGPPKRMAFLYVPNGMHMQDWTPAEVGASYELTPILKPLGEFQSKVNVLSGLSLDGARAHGDGGGDHARSVASFLTGAHPRKTDGSNIKNGPSVDQIAAARIGHLTKLASLEMGTESSAPAGRCDSGYSCLYTSNISWRNETAPIGKEINPRAVFERMFGNDDRSQTDKAIDDRTRRRKSILDYVNDEAKSLHQTLGSADRRKLDEYLYAVRDIERRLSSTEMLDRVEQGIPDYPRPEGVPRRYEDHLNLLFDMLVLAFQTDTTRISTLMYANAGSNRSYRNLGIREGHHNLSHHGNSRTKQEQIAKINVYHSRLFAGLLTKLDRIQEGDGTLLDNCMIMYGSGIADGNSHAHTQLPILLAGGGGGTIETGRHINYKRGTPLTNLYRSMLDRMGAQVNTFSDSDGLLEGLNG
jgi:hypothetical protein